MATERDTHHREGAETGEGGPAEVQKVKPVLGEPQESTSQLEPAAQRHNPVINIMLIMESE